MSVHSRLARLLGFCLNSFYSGSRQRMTGARPSPVRPSVECLEERQAPATLTVNSTADTADPNDPYLSLREAVAIVSSPSLPAGLSDQILGQIQGTLHANGSDLIAFDHGQITRRSG
jgi:hypothetical protein